jgi:hypothetical protein
LNHTVSFLGLIRFLRFAALELQSLKYELEVEHARFAAMELKCKQLQAQLDAAGERSFSGLVSSARPDGTRRPSITPSALAPIHVQVRHAALAHHFFANFAAIRCRSSVWMVQEKA